MRAAGRVPILHRGGMLARRAAVIGPAAAILALAPLPAAPARAAIDYSDVARNIVPSGQYGDANAPPGADQQARLYDGLTPLFDQVGPGDLDRVVDRNWDPPVTMGVRLVSIADDCLQHIGQAAYVRGLLEA